MIDKYPPGTYRQHILAGLLIAGIQPVTVNTHGGGTGAEGSFITATFGQQLMITLYDMAAVTTYTQAWLAEEDQWVFAGLPLQSPGDSQRPAATGPALSVRAHGMDRTRARYDSTSRSAIIRIGSLTWTVQDRLAAESMLDTWRRIADLGPIILSRQAATHRRR